MGQSLCTRRDTPVRMSWHRCTGGCSRALRFPCMGSLTTWRPTRSWRALSVYPGRSSGATATCSCWRQCPASGAAQRQQDVCLQALAAPTRHGHVGMPGPMGLNGRLPRLHAFPASAIYSLFPQFVSQLDHFGRTMEVEHVTCAYRYFYQGVGPIGGHLITRNAVLHGLQRLAHDLDSGITVVS